MPGVPVACASDNVRDAFHAFGDIDVAEVYLQSVRLAHLDSRLGDLRRAGDHGGRGHRRACRAMGASRRAPPAQLVVFPARSFSEFLSRPGFAAAAGRRREHPRRRPPGYGRAAR